jgi:hypothetical protein
MQMKNPPKRNIILISHDILRKDSLGVYSGKSNTPNIDKVSSEGTTFYNYYAGGGSTAMAFTTMFTGLNPNEVKGRAYYKEVKTFDQSETMFQKFQHHGYDSHVIWPKHFDRYVEQYLRIFNKDVNVHSLSSVSTLIPTTKDWSSYKELEKIDGVSHGAIIYLNKIRDILKYNTNPVFIWAHFPHLLSPYKSYGQDIYEFDKFIGELSSEFDIDLFITADHGQMCGEKGLHFYGSWVYEGIVNIPLITPRLSIGPRVEFPVGANQLMDIVIDRIVDRREFIYSDTRYYKQPDRVVMIRSNNYKYIYNKRKGTEELYDLTFDPNENLNLLRQYYYSPERHLFYPYKELFHYEFWEQAEEYYVKLKKEKNRIWRTGNYFDIIVRRLYQVYNIFSISSIKNRIKVRTKLKGKSLGRWGAKVV